MNPIPSGRFPSAARSLALLSILGVAGALRLYGITANLPDYPGWDEPKIVERAFAVGGGNLNPHFFHWPGSLLIYANTFVYVAYFVFGYIAGWFESLREFQRTFQNDPSAFYVLARLLNVTAAFATIWIVWRATAALGFLAQATAALLVAVSPVHVRESALAGTDVPATLLLLVALTMTAESFAGSTSTRSFALSGFVLGLGTAIKYYVGVGGLGIACAAILSRKRWVQRGNLVIVAGSSALVGFVIGCPFSVLAFSEFRADFMAQVHHHSRGHILFDPEGNAALWYVRNSLAPALGLPALAAGCYGLIAIARYHRQFLPIVVTAIVYFAVAALSNVSFQRYAVPHVPMLAVAVAVATWRVSAMRWFAWLLVACVVAVPLWGAVSVAIDRGKEDTRVAAAGWLHANVASSARVLGSPEGPRFRTTITTSRHSPITAEQFAIVESGGVDVFVLMSSMTTSMQSETALKNHPEIASSHLRLYEWVKTHATLQAAFHPGPSHKGYAVEIFATRRTAAKSESPVP